MITSSLTPSFWTNSILSSHTITNKPLVSRGVNPYVRYMQCASACGNDWVRGHGCIRALQPVSYIKKKTADQKSFIKMIYLYVYGIPVSQAVKNKFHDHRMITV